MQKVRVHLMGFKAHFYCLSYFSPIETINCLNIDPHVLRKILLWIRSMSLLTNHVDCIKQPTSLLIFYYVSIMEVKNNQKSDVI